MSIVNINDDSFSDDGTLDSAEALGIANQHISEGADIIDIGAESARTNRGPITEGEEIARLSSFLEKWQDLPTRPQIAINSWRPGVISAILSRFTIDIVNDISGLPRSTNAELAARHGARLVIMHSVGEPKVPHTHQLYDDVWATMLGFFNEKIALARSAGLKADDIILDPGIDFAKQRDDNLRIYKQLHRLTALGHQLLIPVSRKTVIGDVLGITDPKDRDAGTIACLAQAHSSGRHIYRVHNTRAASTSLKVLDAAAPFARTSSATNT